jgi:phosphate transport system ATP-binding protein
VDPPTLIDVDQRRQVTEERTAFFSIEGAGKPGKLVEVDDTETIFPTPQRQATIDDVTGRFG